MGNIPILNPQKVSSILIKLGFEEIRNLRHRLLPMLRDAMSFSDPPDVFDLLVLESTYGDRNHENRADQQTLCDWVKSMPEPPE